MRGEEEQSQEQVHVLGWESEEGEHQVGRDPHPMNPQGSDEWIGERGWEVPPLGRGSEERRGGSRGSGRERRRMSVRRGRRM